ncbi:MAG: stage V sporulation protein AE [Clostridia bacterium]|nr:stage V sporulation protein AE [Clostridia bacterium]
MQYIWAFLIGGLFCVVGQLLIDYTKLTPARILVGYVVAGVFLTAIGVYEPLIKFAGAGASVPLTGFGYLLANGVKQAVQATGVSGIFTGGLTAASGGICAAIVFSYIMALIAKSKDQS